jgi:hypothetical protein
MRLREIINEDVDVVAEGQKEESDVAGGNMLGMIMGDIQEVV